jgi:hypothetical protein
VSIAGVKVADWRDGLQHTDYAENCSDEDRDEAMVWRQCKYPLLIRRSARSVNKHASGKSLTAYLLTHRDVGSVLAAETISGGLIATS